MFGLSGVPTWSLVAPLVPLAGSLGILIGQRMGGSDEGDLAEFRDENGELPDEIDVDEPTLRGSRFGMVGEVLKMWRHRRKVERLAGKGYVRWFLIDDTWPSAKFVKPENKGAGQPEYEHDEGIYLFPKHAAKPHRETGMWTYVHQKGDSEPVNVINHRETVLPAEDAKQWADQAVTSDRPDDGMFAFLGDMDPQQIMVLGVVGIAVFAVVMGGF